MPMFSALDLTGETRVVRAADTLKLCRFHGLTPGGDRDEWCMVLSSVSDISIEPPQFHALGLLHKPPQILAQ
jgi:hypothetical protein